VIVWRTKLDCSAAMTEQALLFRDDDSVGYGTVAQASLEDLNCISSLSRFLAISLVCSGFARCLVSRSLEL